MKKIITTILLSSMLLFACNNSANENKKSESASHKDAHHHDEDNAVIVLNNGEKWKVDDNMMIHIRAMENDINEFNTQSEESYKELSKKLDKNIDLLTSNCTMEGQAHDELHKWLLPFIDLSENFKNSKTLQEYATHFEEIKTTFIHFNTYFK